MHKRCLCILVIVFSIISLFNSGYSSLPTGTMIATPNGLVRVETLKIGDKVLSYDSDASKPEDAIVAVTVTNVDKHLTESAFSIYTGKHRWIDASPKQLFFTIKRSVKDSSNTAIVNFVEAQCLTTDHELVDSGMQCIPIVKIKKVECCTTKTTKHSVEKTIIKVYVYAIEVEKPHTLLVAENFYNANASAKLRLLLTHNGIPALGLGVSLAFGSTPASISLAGASANLGGLGVAFGPAGLAIGLVTSLGILGYQLHKSKNKKQDTDYFECSDSCAAPGGPDPRDPKNEKDREGNNAGEFEKKISKMPACERVAAVRSEAEMVAKRMGWDEVPRHISVKNKGRIIYADENAKRFYSVDTQHGRFEVLNKNGTHLGEADFDLNFTKGPDASGLHDLNIR